MPDLGNGGFQVHISRTVANDIRRLQQQALIRGQGKAFLLALRRIVEALEKDPFTLGEPLYRLQSLRLQVRTVVIAPVAIDFAASEDHHFVFIKGGRLLSRRGH